MAKAGFLLLIVLLSISTLPQSQLRRGTAPHSAKANQRTIQTPESVQNTESYFFANFEDAGFPPAGWSLSSAANQYWSRSSTVSAYGIGSACAKFAFYNANSGVQQPLTSPTFPPTNPNDSLRFDFSYATYTGNQVDQLKIEFSLDGGATWNQLVLLSGGSAGDLTTAPGQSGPFTPTATQWNTRVIPLQNGTNKLRFTAISAHGNNLYLDNIKVGALPVNDVGVGAFPYPVVQASGVNPVIATIKNFGSAPQTNFTVTAMTIPAGYSSTKTVSALNPGAVVDVPFDDWNAKNGVYTLRVFTQLAGDMNSSNDTASVVVTVTDPTIQVAAPAGGEVWGVGTQQNIRWTANFRKNIQIEYSIDSGATWQPIAVAPALKTVAQREDQGVRVATMRDASGGQFLWTVPNTPAKYCKIRLSLAENPAINKVSAGYFSIAVIPQPIVKFEDRFNGDNSVAGLQARGWIVVDLDGGGKMPPFFQGGNDADTFGAYEGPDTGYVAMNFAGANGRLINQWLISPPVQVTPGDSLTFFERSPDSSAYDDTLYVRVSPTGDTAVASFTQLLDRFKTSTSGWAYWGKPFQTAGTVRFAIQYYIVNGGEDGLYSDYVGIDWLRVLNHGAPAGVLSDALKADKFVLHQNYPNPFNPSTTISFSIPENSRVRLVIYNALGEQVANLLNQDLAAGNHQIVWSADHFSSGVYFCRIEAGKNVATRKLLLMK
jgi:hypothetical protein